MEFYLLIFLLLLPVVLGNVCVPYNFEDGFEEFDPTLGTVCQTVNNNWDLREYNSSSISVLPPHELSVAFITSIAPSSCVSSFFFDVENDGVIEVNLYVFFSEFLTIGIYNEANQQISSWTSFSNPIPANEWTTVTFTVSTVESFRGYLSIFATVSVSETILIDSFRYIPPNSNLDDTECAIYSYDTNDGTTVADQTTTDNITTEPTTTNEPTTNEPTTDEPTTEEPTTEEPTTEEITTEEITTEEPTTEEPTTEEPTTEEPTTEEPTTEEPTTEEPTTEEPTTEEPTTEEPTTEEPTTDESTTDQPTTDGATTEEPTTYDATTAQPITDEPTTAEPNTDEPTTDEPTTEDPTTDEATTAQPITDEPTTVEPNTDVPTTNEPTTDEATTNEATTNDPPETEITTTNAPTTDSNTDGTTTEETTENPDLIEETDSSFWSPLTIALVATGCFLFLVILCYISYRCGKRKEKKKIPDILYLDIEELPKTVIVPRVRKVYTDSMSNSNPYAKDYF